jgi:hypothetical protein
MRLAPLALVLLVGCTPLVRYRQGALVEPTAPMPIVGAPLEPGEVAVGGGITGGPVPNADASVLFASYGDPGIWANPVRLDGWVRDAPNEMVEYGAHADVGLGNPYPSSIGVPPVDGAAWGGGVWFGLTPPLGEHVHFVTRFDTGFVATPWSRWELDEGLPQDQYVLGDGLEYYHLIAEGTEITPRFSLASGLTGKIGVGDLGFALGATTQITNTGFADSVESPARQGPIGGYASLNGGVRVDRVHFIGGAWVQLVGGSASGFATPFAGGQIGVEYIPPKAGSAE